MNRIIYRLMLFLLLIYSDDTKAEEKYKIAINNILEIYPEATLQDIYKSFFQDMFGPEHIIVDTASVSKYLQFELENMEETSMPYYESAGTGDNFIRVSLQTVKDSLISEEELLNLFIASANSERKVSIDDWIEEWGIIKGFVPSDIKDFQTDNERIEMVLDSGQYAIHHSRIYNELYKPHYRIIRKELFEEKILPKIESSMKKNGQLVK